MSDDLSTEIQRAAVEPRSVTVDGVNVQQPSVREVIAADQYAKAATAKSRNHLGLTFRKMIPGD